MRFVHAVLSATLAGTLLTGCGTARGKQEAMSCPQAGVLADAGQQIKFREGGRVRADALYEARIVGASAGNCRIAQDGSGTVDLRIPIQVIRGPAATETNLPLDYFVAVVGPEGQVLWREAFRVDLNIPQNRNGANVNEELTLRIPLSRGTRLEDYRVYAALQLTAEELEYNRQTGGR